MEKKDIREILEKVSSGQYTAEDEQAAKLWLFQLHQDDEVKLSESQLSGSKRKVWDNLQIYRQPQIATITKLWPRIAAAAVILIAVGAGIVFYLNNQKPPANIESTYANDIAPGKVGATLTLASGKKIRLTDALNGEVANEAGISITKTADGQLVYEMKSSDTNPNKINTLSTAKGETYQVHLPDGSLVYLNAASSLTYAASLIEHGKRVVRLHGEGYFEISKDKAHPFVVKTNRQEIEVLGTHFNISSYQNDQVEKTTLLEGSIKISESSSAYTGLLKPGQQAVCSKEGVEIGVADVEEAVAWKNGFFRFNEEPLVNIMDKLSRWYDIEVSYEGGIERYRDLRFGGFVPRTIPVSTVLKIMAKTGKVSFSVNQKKVFVRIR